MPQITPCPMHGVGEDSASRDDRECSPRARPRDGRRAGRTPDGEPQFALLFRKGDGTSPGIGLAAGKGATAVGLSTTVLVTEPKWLILPLPQSFSAEPQGGL